MGLITVSNLSKFYKGMRGSSIFYISFVGASEGDSYRIASGSEIYVGEVPSSLEIVQSVKGLNTSYTVSVTHNSSTYYTTVSVGKYYGVYNISLVSSNLFSIQVTHSLNRTTYNVGDYIDLNGLEVTANYIDETELEVTSGVTFNISKDHRLTAQDTSLIVYYTESGVTKTATIPLVITNIDISSLVSRISALETTVSELNEYALKVTLPDDSD